MPMPSDSTGSPLTAPGVQVLLDGLPVTLPPERRSFAAVRSYLETLALEQQRLLSALKVDGEALNLTGPVPVERTFTRVEAETIGLDHVPLQLVQTAMEQTIRASGNVACAVSLVMINPGDWARELWWNLARELNQPLLTLSLMPETMHGPANGGTSLKQLRKWQFQQLAAIIKNVDEAAAAADPTALSNALEHRVLPWLNGLLATLDLWHETLLAGERAAAHGLNLVPPTQTKLSPQD
jgi:hypothetical protein